MKHYQYPNAVMQIFCKAPIAGQVKTRLQPELTAAQAVAVHQCLTLRTIELITARAFCPVQLWCTPVIGHPFFAYLAKKYSLELKLQAEGDLGQRMDLAITEGITRFGCAILIGCDCPSFTQEDIVTALQTLTTDFDAVLAPTEDGGYSLIGLRQPQPALFKDILWGSEQALQQTRAKIHTLNIRHHELPVQWDVDTYADYVRYASAK